MTKSKKLETIANRWDSEISLLTWLATSISVFSFLFYFQRGEVLLYGDAIAHINIARRVFDSKTPGLLQLGTVWLPLPHLLMIPFIISMKMWRTGAGGSIPSMGAYVFGVAGIFRLTRDALSRGPSPDITAHLAAWFAAAVYAANPNLIYMQSTAMGESVYLAFFIWAVLYFLEATRGNPRSLTKCGLCLVGACLTRYDGWFLAAAMIAIVLLDSLRGERSLLRRNLFATDRVAGRDRRDPSDRPLQHRGRSGHAPDTLETPLQHRGRAALQGRVSHSNIQGALAPVLVKFVLLGALGPALWLAYNGIVYRNPLEFENGPYSAKAIEKRTQTGGNPGHPGSGSPVVAALYFSKAAQDNVAENAWLQRAWVLLLIVALVAAIYLWGTQTMRINTCRSPFAPDPASVLRPVHRVWWSTDLHPAMVALHSLQCSLRTPTTPRVFLRLGSAAVRHPSFLMGTSSALRQCPCAFGARGGELRLYLARRTDLSRGSRGQHAYAYSTRT